MVSPTVISRLVRHLHFADAHFAQIEALGSAFDTQIKELRVIADALSTAQEHGDDKLKALQPLSTIPAPDEGHVGESAETHSSDCIEGKRVAFSLCPSLNSKRSNITADSIPAERTGTSKAPIRCEEESYDNVGSDGSACVGLVASASCPPPLLMRHNFRTQDSCVRYELDSDSSCDFKVAPRSGAATPRSTATRNLDSLTGADAVIHMISFNSAARGSTGRKKSKRSSSTFESRLPETLSFMERLKTSAGKTQIPVVRSMYQTLWWAIEFWLTLTEPPRTSVLASIVASVLFDWLGMAVIVCHTVFTILYTNWEIQHFGQEPPVAAVATEVSFQSFYIVEVLLRLLVHRLYFFCNYESKWNIFDFVLSIFGAYEVISIVEGRALGTRLGFLRVLKILRLIRVMQVSSDLRRLLRSLIGSLSSLFWVVVMMAFLLVIFSVFFMHLATQRLHSVEGPEMLGVDFEADAVGETFSSIQSTMLALYMATSGGEDWSATYALIGQTGTVGGIAFVFYVGFFHFAIFNVLTGCFVEKAMWYAKPDHHAMMMEMSTREATDIRELWDIAQEIDSDNSGVIILRDLKVFLRQPRHKRHMAILQVDIKDPDAFYNMLASVSPDGEVTTQIFVEACMKLKGEATCIDLHTFAMETTLLHQKLSRTLQDLTTKMSLLSDRFGLTSSRDINSDVSALNRGAMHLRLNDGRASKNISFQLSPRASPGHSAEACEREQTGTSAASASILPVTCSAFRVPIKTSLNL
mmetsp:Transcript_97/g.340  ORF Transcript_97/g.340 Transcript_97/m.340 type:complete len:753 (+) Transcript_97:25-2283(+)